MSKRLTDSERLGYDAVNLPAHYSRFKIEPIYFAEENGLGFLQSSILKYILRYPFKNGVEDLLKARRCLDMLIAKEQGNPDWWKSPPTAQSKEPETK